MPLPQLSETDLLQIVGEDLKSSQAAQGTFHQMLSRFLAPFEQMYQQHEKQVYPNGVPPERQISPEDKAYTTPEKMKAARDPSRKIRT